VTFGNSEISLFIFKCILGSPRSKGLCPRLSYLMSPSFLNLVKEVYLRLGSLLSW